VRLMCFSSSRCSSKLRASMAFVPPRRTNSAMLLGFAPSDPSRLQAG
jgi:hypothetical protein